MSSRGFSPSQFMSNADNLGGLAKTWKFSVQILKCPAEITAAGSTIEFLASGADLPTKGFATTEHQTYGIKRTIPYEQTYEAMDIEFHNTNDFTPKKFWDDWMNLITSPTTYNLSYYKKYTGKIAISHYGDDITEPDPQSSSTYTCTLFEAYPERMSAITLGWGVGELMKFTVSVRYKYWEGKKPPIKYR